MTPLSLVPHSSNVDLSQWSGRPYSWSGVAKALQEQMDYEPPTLEMPITYSWNNSDGRGGPAIEDPLTIYLNIPALTSELRSTLYSCSLKHIIWGLMQEHRTQGDEEGGEAAKAVFTGLVELMEQLKQCILEQDPNAFSCE